MFVLKCIVLGFLAFLALLLFFVIIYDSRQGEDKPPKETRLPNGTFLLEYVKKSRKKTPPATVVRRVSKYNYRVD